MTVTKQLDVFLEQEIGPIKYDKQIRFTFPRGMEISTARERADSKATKVAYVYNRDI